MIDGSSSDGSSIVRKYRPFEWWYSVGWVFVLVQRVWADLLLLNGDGRSLRDICKPTSFFSLTKWICLTIVSVDGGGGTDESVTFSLVAAETLTNKNQKMIP